MTEFYGHKNLMTQRKIGLSCILFSKTQVCQRLLKNPNAAYPLMLVPRSRQVWSHSPLVQAVQVQTHEYTKENRQKNVYEKLTANYFI